MRLDLLQFAVAVGAYVLTVGVGAYVVARVEGRRALPREVELLDHQTRFREENIKRVQRTYLDGDIDVEKLEQTLEVILGVEAPPRRWDGPPGRSRQQTLPSHVHKMDERCLNDELDRREIARELRDGAVVGGCGMIVATVPRPETDEQPS